MYTVSPTFVEIYLIYTDLITKKNSFAVAQDWLQVNCPGFTEFTVAAKLSRFEPIGLSCLGSQAGKEP